MSEGVTKATLVSGFHSFRLERATNKIIWFCSFQVDNKCIVQIDNISYFVGQLVCTLYLQFQIKLVRIELELSQDDI